MRVLLFGSTGFIGRNLKEFFESVGKYELFCPTRDQLNLLDESAVDNYLREIKPDIVINSAVCRNPRYFSSESMETELAQDLRMFHILEKRQDLYGKLLYFGSGAEYGKQNPIVSVKEEELSCDLPLTQYGLAKYTIGKLINQSENIYNLRIFGLFGKYENWKTTFISGACCKAVYKLPITIRQNVFFDYLYINDFCKVINWFIENSPKYKTYNVTSGNRIDLLSIAKIINQTTGYDCPIYIGKAGLGNEYTGCNQRLLNEYIDFEPENIKDSINDLLCYYERNKDAIDPLLLLYPS